MTHRSLRPATVIKHAVSRDRQDQGPITSPLAPAAEIPERLFVLVCVAEHAPVCLGGGVAVRWEHVHSAVGIAMLGFITALGL